MSFSLLAFTAASRGTTLSAHFTRGTASNSEQSLPSSQHHEPFLLALLMHEGSSLPSFPLSRSHSAHEPEGEGEHVLKEAQQLMVRNKTLPNRTQV